MLALLLSLASFIIALIVGYAAMVMLRPRDYLRNALLAPVFGLAIFLLPTFWLNRFGIPVSHFGTPLVVIILLAAAAALIVKRPGFPLRQVWPFFIVYLIALLFVGQPFLHYGFAWVSFSNDDMANYALAAERFLDGGYLDVPKAGEYIANQNPSSVSWQLYVLNGSRSGADLMLALLSSVTRLMPASCFMPLIVAFYLALLSAGAALVYSKGALRVAALTATVWLAASALTGFGVLYQLLGQVDGLGILCAALALTLVLDRPRARIRLVKDCIAGAIILSALGISYPETIPFFVLTLLIFYGINILRRRVDVGAAIRRLTLTAAICLVCWNTYLPAMLLFFESQTSSGLTTQQANALTFPFYLIPTGPAVLWGLFEVAQTPQEPWLSLGILASFVLIVAAVGAAFWLSFKGNAIGVITIVIFATAILLITRRNDFGLYKLAMYVQPFMIGSVVIAWLSLTRRWYEQA